MRLLPGRGAMLLLLGDTMLAAATLLAARLYGVRRVGLPAALVAAAFSAQWVPALAVAPLVGLAAGWQVVRGQGYGRVVAAASLPALLQALFLLLAAQQDPGSREQLVEELVAQVQSMGLEQIEDGYSLRQMVRLGLRLQPGVGFLSLLLAAVLAYLLSVRVAARLGVLLPPPRPLAQWRLWDALIWALIAGLALALTGWWEDLGFNLILVTLVLYAVQGLALLRFYVGRLGITRALEWFFYLVLLFTAGLALPVLVGAGLLETWFDWRGLLPADPAAGERGEG